METVRLEDLDRNSIEYFAENYKDNRRKIYYAGWGASLDVLNEYLVYAKFIYFLSLAYDIPSSLKNKIDNLFLNNGNVRHFDRPDFQDLSKSLGIDICQVNNNNNYFQKKVTPKIKKEVFKDFDEFCKKQSKQGFKPEGFVLRKYVPFKDFKKTIELSTRKKHLSSLESGLYNRHEKMFYKAKTRCNFLLLHDTSWPDNMKIKSFFPYTYPYFACFETGNECYRDYKFLTLLKEYPFNIIWFLPNQRICVFCINKKIYYIHSNCKLL